MKNNYADEEMLSVICSNLAAVYRDGLKINEAVKIITDAVENNAYKKSFEDVLQNLKQGKSLSESFKTYDNLYPYLFTSMIHIGEESGKLNEVFEALDIYYRQYSNIKKTIKKAMVYPLFIFTCFMFVVLFMIRYIIPNIIEIYTSMNIEKSSGVLILAEICDFINKDFISFIAFTLIYCFIIPIMIFTKLYKNINMEILRKFKIVKIYIEYRVVLILYIIISSKTNISTGLKVCRNSMGSDLLNKIILFVDDEVNKGNSLSDTIEKTQILSDYSIAIIKIREESGSLEEGLYHLVLRLQNMMLEKINSYLACLQPAIIIGMSFIVGMFIIGAVLPLFDGITKIGI